MHADEKNYYKLNFMKMKNNTILIVILVCMLMQGCATSKFTQTGDNYPPYKGLVKVFTCKPKNIEYEEIGWVSSSGGMIHEWTDLIEAMQTKAAAKGANAIILIESERPDSGIITYNQHIGMIGGYGNQKSMTAIAIRIKDK